MSTNHPLPKKIKVFVTSSFGAESNGDTNVFEYDTARKVDFMRYRMDRIWNKNIGNNGTSFVEHVQPSLSPVFVSSLPPGQDPIYSETSVSIPNTPYTEKTEKVVLQANRSAIEGAGNEPSPGIKELPDKWLFALTSNPLYANNTIEQNILRSGIVATFDNLSASSGYVEFDELSFEYEAPLSKKEVGDNFYGSLSINEADVKPVYNFYIRPYESILVQDNSNLEPPESLLPSLYSFLSVVQNDDPQTSGIQEQGGTQITDTIFEKHATLNGAIKETRVTRQVTFNAGGRSQQSQGAVSKGQYFDKYSYAWAEYAERLAGLSEREIFEEQVIATQGGTQLLRPTGPNQSTQALFALRNKFKNQIIPLSDVDLFSDFNETAERFPMFCELNFSTDNSNDLVNIFEDTDMMNLFIKDYVDNKFGNPKNIDMNFVSTDQVPFQPNTNFTSQNIQPIGETVSENVLEGSLRSYELNDWLQNVNIPSTNDQANLVILGKYDQNVNLTQTQSYVKNMLLAVFKAHMGQKASEKTRDWKKIIGGSFIGTEFEPELSYNETIFYKVEKWSVNADGTPNENLQNFYFPNSKSISEHNFTDTQVKYGKKYIYRIYAMNMVFGTKYSYREDIMPVDNSGQTGGKIIPEELQARICVVSEPTIRLVEVPYFQKEIVMMDSPPVFPDVEVVNYRNKRDRITFWLNGNVGEYKLKPILIQNGDRQIMDSIRMAQELNPIEPVTFKSDDQARYFEVYRIETKPNRYSDFKNNRIAFIDTDEKLNDFCLSATGGEFTDKTIEPNKKYYYMFRTIDNHGHFSNPSPVYELEMVYDGYAPFLLSNVYMLDENPFPPTEPTKKFTKYIYIKPAVSQKMVNEVSSGIKDEEGNPLVGGTNALTQKGSDGKWIILGTDDQNLWDKSLKIRIISKKTGKKIDLNVKYTKQHVELTEGNENKIC